MPDKLTDRKIPDIKELLAYKAKVGCQNCDLIGKGCCGTCVNSLIKQFIELFDRLQADCENYKQVAENQQSVTMDRGFEIKRLKEKIESLQAENEKLKSINLLGEYKARIQVGNMIVCTPKIGEWFEFLKKTKAEAYKEFAERLKEKAISTGFWQEYGYITTTDIDNLLKELVGDNNA